MSFKSFWTSDMVSKNDVLMSTLTFFVRSFVRSNSAIFPASDWFYCYYRSPEHGRSPAGLWSTVRSGTSQHSDQFLILGCVECGGRWVLSQASLLLFLNVVMLPHHSGQIPETAALYYTRAKNQERQVYTLWKRGPNQIDPGSLRTSWTTVELGLGATGKVQKQNK
jgi:hypothetical protein